MAFISEFNVMQEAVHQTAMAHGWWDEPRREAGTVLMNIVGEVAEAFDALAHGNQPDKHLPRFSAVEVELADTVIRIMDFAQANGWNVAAALVAKAQYNEGRPYKHGKEF